MGSNKAVGEHLDTNHNSSVASIENTQKYNTHMHTHTVYARKYNSKCFLALEVLAFFSSLPIKIK